MTTVQLVLDEIGILNRFRSIYSSEAPASSSVIVRSSGDGAEIGAAIICTTTCSD